ncbi:MAG: FMN-binding protein [Elusimicrobia bacterium]|jgi:uncharacterized protein with FMN-binding domain|nr:FMN-binding protein [Elusimicrobiota bacterium]
MKNLLVIIIVMVLSGMLAISGKFFKENSGKEKEYIESRESKFSQGGFSEGAYIGTGEGFAGKIKVKVTFSRAVSTCPATMTEISVIQHSEIEQYWLNVKENILSDILKNGTGRPDAQTGATESARGLREAIKDAEKQSHRRD